MPQGGILSGKLIGVGLGPGDPELLTLKAMHIIQQAPVLVYTVDDKGSSFARQIAAEHIRQGQVELPLFFSMSPKRSERQQTRQNAARQVLEVLQQDQDVVFITEGDPLLYSTFQHLLAEMPPQIEFSVCPGISAMFSAAAAAGFPLAIEEQMVIVAPAGAARGQIDTWLQAGNSLVLFKPARWLTDIAEEIKAANLPCKTTLVCHASTNEEVILHKLSDWDERKMPYFSILLIRPLEPHK